MSPLLRYAAPLSYAFALWLLLEGEAHARTLDATPANLNTQLGMLTPGDVLRLAPGNYAHFTLSNLNGRADAPIVIEGAEGIRPAVIQADSAPCCNTIEIRNSSFVTLRRLTVDGRNVDGAFGVSVNGGASNVVHHITIEDCSFLNHDASQGTVAISTKVPTWGWVIRRNRFLDVGTGLYLGNSDGTQPFVGGIIENNYFHNCVGYCMQIKWQLPRPAVAGMPTDPATTIIRHNVFIKTDTTPESPRPLLLVGGFPDTGPGSTDRYEIYGNVFAHNPAESLLQASGRVTIHDNLFVDVAGTAIQLQNHDRPLRQAYVYNNTIYSAGTGVNVSASGAESVVVGNLIFANMPITGTIGMQRDNQVGPASMAATVLNAPGTMVGSFDLHPRAGQARGAAADLAAFANDTDHDRDFNCRARDDRTFRGAYAGDGTNPGWMVTSDIKPACGSNPQPGPGDAGADASTPDGSIVGPADAGTDARLPDGAIRDDMGPAARGCACRAGTASNRASSARPWSLVGALVVFGAVRRRRRAGGDVQ